MSMANSLIGQKINHFTVLEDTGKRTSDRRIIFKCQCDCGNIIEISSKTLKNGDRKDCGCLKKIKKVKDLKGQRFGKLTVLELMPLKGGNASWKCICDCGNETIVTSTHLQSGHTKSCGCLNHKIIYDLTNQQFGKLTVIKQVKKPENKNKTGSYWLCKCECGNEIITLGENLRSGGSKSCGCLKSAGEYQITQLLLNNNIKFETQKTFKTCRFPDTNRLGYFDFYIDNQFLLEYDGPQHFFYQNSGWNNLNYYSNITQKDTYKNQWCKENNIPLKRIPYWELENLTIEDIMGDKFLLKEDNNV